MNVTIIPARLEDVALASAIVLNHRLPRLMALPKAERLDHLTRHIETALRSHQDGRPRAEPSAN